LFHSVHILKNGFLCEFGLVPVFLIKFLNG